MTTLRPVQETDPIVSMAIECGRRLPPDTIIDFDYDALQSNADALAGHAVDLSHKTFEIGRQPGLLSGDFDLDTETIRLRLRRPALTSFMNHTLNHELQHLIDFQDQRLGGEGRLTESTYKLATFMIKKVAWPIIAADVGIFMGVPIAHNTGVLPGKALDGVVDWMSGHTWLH